MNDKDNLQLAELDGDGRAGEIKAPQSARDLEAVYEVPVQISAVLGRAWAAETTSGYGATVADLDSETRSGGSRTSCPGIHFSRV